MHKIKYNTSEVVLETVNIESIARNNFDSPTIEREILFISSFSLKMKIYVRFESSTNGCTEQ